MNKKTEDLNKRREFVEERENNLRLKLSKLNTNQLELFNQILSKIDKEEDLENNSLINTYQLKQDYLKIKNNYFDEISKEILLIANMICNLMNVKKKTKIFR